jgi:ankyrin repeat protein
MEQSDEAYLFDAIEKGDYNSVYSLIETRKVNPNSILTRIVTQKETQDYTALYLAASLGKARICRLLLSKGAHPFHKMVFGMYPIHISADRGWLEVLKVLLEVPESVNKQDDNGDTPLHLSALRGHGDCVIELVSAGADLSLVNDSGRTPLEEAQKSQKTNIVNYLTRQTILSKRANKAVNRTLSDHCGTLKAITVQSYLIVQKKLCLIDFVLGNRGAAPSAAGVSGRCSRRGLDSWFQCVITDWPICLSGYFQYGRR